MPRAANDGVRTSLLLGRGGRSPGVDLFDDESNCIRPLMQLSLGQSVYAIAFNPALGDTIVAGTKDGLLCLSSGSQNTEADTSTPDQQVIHGSPVLSVCFLSSSSIAASDAHGRCLIWDLDDPSTPVGLPIAGHVVCSLLQLDEHCLAGLSTRGTILQWNVPERRLICTAASSPPPRWSALVELVAWPAANALVYPAENGILVLYDPKENTTRQLAAHQGDFFALIDVEEDLITIGCQDGRLKRWRDGRDEPLSEHRIPQGVVSAAVIGDRPIRLLLVHDHGAASSCHLGDSDVIPEGLMAGHDYRVVRGPSWQAIKAAGMRHRAEEAQQIAAQIRGGLGHHAAGEMEHFHAELVDRGYIHVSLALRAEQARYSEEICAELEAYRDLLRVLPDNTGLASSSLARYAALLEQVWQLEPAAALYARIADVQPSSLKYASQLTPLIQALATGQAVIEPDVPLETVLSAAALIGRGLNARLLFKSLGPLACHAILTMEQFVATYDEVRRRHAGRNLPVATPCSVRWLSRAQLEMVNLITFATIGSDEMNVLQFGVKVVPGDSQTVVAPVVLLNPESWDGENEDDRAFAVALERLRNRAQRTGRFAGIYAAVKHTLRQLVSREVSARTG